MTATSAVADGDIRTEARKLFKGKLEDLERRVVEETLPIAPVAAALQEIVEGKFVIGGLLRFVGAIKLKAVKKRFVVADNFKVGNIVGGRRIDWIGPNFHEHFDDLVEENVPARTVFQWELIKGSLDEPIVNLLGGFDNVKTETHLAHTFQMMALGEKGKGRLDGYSNFGYKKSPKDGLLWVPSWNVGGGEFYVGAASASYPVEWAGGSRVSGG